MFYLYLCAIVCIVLVLCCMYSLTTRTILLTLELTPMEAVYALGMGVAFVLSCIVREILSCVYNSSFFIGDQLLWITIPLPNRETYFGSVFIRFHIFVHQIHLFFVFNDTPSWMYSLQLKQWYVLPRDGNCYLLESIPLWQCERSMDTFLVKLPVIAKIIHKRFRWMKLLPNYIASESGRIQKTVSIEKQINLILCIYLLAYNLRTIYQYQWIII